ncbi:hypothetical protein M409DRAFT_55611 [Zasmidium cellare ATCC 36951]|uniref:F-box domain-containing protein n=1 Tax=Zasmidium cellare ATCC 36951 TaxID=1080233 RepID=A0A6A6CHR8_ZASCE|nr:uncharacterized protein M409DRAFT_55611 [Zasmidium cellare ATCC 36951]KAF2165730.1 hypothetical protein M409DRAFT_55611 [Zasmidium cellare ATCC 36951]
MAEPHADDPPEDLESALKQNRALRQALAAHADRIQELERQNQQLQRQTQQPDNSATWLLDRAIQRDRDGLLDDLDDLDAFDEPQPTPLGGKPLSLEARTALVAEVVRKGCFRFLDLPPEIRNRIYALVAKDAFSVPCMLAYVPSWKRRLDKLEPELEEQYINHEIRCAEEPFRLLMLRVSRQVHDECRQIFYCNMSLDLSNMYLPSTSGMMLDLIASPFSNKLQFVRHVELESNAAQYVLFNARSSSDTEFWRGLWETDYNTPSMSFRSMNQLRTLLFNLEAVTIYEGPDHISYHDSPSIGWNVVFLLSQKTGLCLERLYPRLNDIVTVNNYGSERIRKAGPREWELHYSREKIPSETRHDSQQLPGSGLWTRRRPYALRNHCEHGGHRQCG